MRRVAEASRLAERQDLCSEFGRPLGLPPEQVQAGQASQHGVLLADIGTALEQLHGLLARAVPDLQLGVLEGDVQVVVHDVPPSLAHLRSVSSKFRGSAGWALGGRVPTPAERERILGEPFRMAILPLVFWVLATAVIGEAAAKIRQGYSVLIFPEGGRTREGTMRQFKPGAGYVAIRLIGPRAGIVLTGVLGGLALVQLAPEGLAAGDVGRGHVQRALGHGDVVHAVAQPAVGRGEDPEILVDGGVLETGQSPGDLELGEGGHGCTIVPTPSRTRRCCAWRTWTPTCGHRSARCS